MKLLTKNILLLTVVLALSSCAKEEFAVNKGSQNSAISQVGQTSTKLCSQSTLISPQVDILMVWDNSSSFNFVSNGTKESLSQLISNVSEGFDYHILSLPLVSTNTSNALNEGVLVTKDTTGLASSALNIRKTKEQAVASISFTKTTSGLERGVERVTSIIEANRSNGIFRNNAYTIVVVMSNEDDDSCEADTGLNTCATSTWKARMQTQIDKLLCLRGNSTVTNCSALGVTTPLNSSMMRFINISGLQVCSSNIQTNYRYRMVASSLYQATYTNGWPQANDHISPDVSGAFDSYDLCRLYSGSTVTSSNIFDGVNSAIKQTLIKHVYNYWPVASSGTSIDPDTIRVVRTDGKILTNRTGESNPTDGYQYIGNSSNNTRIYPTVGEPYSGKMIRLMGSYDTSTYQRTGDYVVHPECLTITYSAEKDTYGYVYLKYGEPNVTTIELRINGVLVPQDAANGWDYMGLQYTAGLDPNLKVAELPSGGASSGYFLRLNGTSKFRNTTNVTITVYYLSKN